MANLMMRYYFEHVSGGVLSSCELRPLGDNRAGRVAAIAVLECGNASLGTMKYDDVYYHHGVGKIMVEVCAES